MTNRARCGLAAAAALGAALSGCTTPQHIEITSYRDPYFPETFAVDFSEVAFRRDPGGDYHVAARAVRPGDGVTQLLHVHVYWRPRPGKTHADKSAANASIRYLISSPQGMSLYAGAAFAYPTPTRSGLTLAIEQSRLRLEAQRGPADDLLGEMRLLATLHCADDGPRAVDMQRELELRAAGADFEPASAPAGEPVR